MQQAIVGRSYTFEAAHFLPNVPDNHKCKRVHGHNYRVVVSIEGDIDGHTGFVIDFFELDAHMAPFVAALDHRLLNDISGLENPTAELIARWFYNRLYKSLWEYNSGDGGGGIKSFTVRVYETDNAYAEVSRP